MTTSRNYNFGVDSCTISDHVHLGARKWTGAVNRVKDTKNRAYYHRSTYMMLVSITTLTAIFWFNGTRDHRSYLRNLVSCESKTSKIQARTGFEPIFSTIPVQCSTNGQFPIRDESAGNQGSWFIILCSLFWTGYLFALIYLFGYLFAWIQLPWLPAGTFHQGNCPCVHVSSQLGAGHVMDCKIKAAFVFSSVHNCNNLSSCLEVPDHSNALSYENANFLLQFRLSSRLKRPIGNSDENGGFRKRWRKKRHTLSIPSAFSGVFYINDRRKRIKK